MTGTSLTGPMSALIKNAMQKTGVRPNLPTTQGRVVAVSLGRLEPLITDPEHSPLAQQVLASLEKVRQVALTGVMAAGPDNAFNRRGETVALTFTDYKDAIRNGRTILADFEKAAKRDGSSFQYLVPADKAEMSRFLLNIYKKEMHTPDFQGYLNYVTSVHPAYGACIQRIPPPILDDKAREQHTYITGGSGSGKTELMKALVYHDLGHENRAIVIIDPQGRFASAVARWEEFAGEQADRLVYFNPRLAPGRVPTLNPLDAEHLTKEERSILADQLTDVMSQVIGRSEWTTQTETVASNCFQVAVNTRRATLRDLRLALVETDGKKGKAPPMVEEIVRIGKQHHIAEVRDFFEYDFFRSNFVSSKNSFSAKLGNILRNELFAKVTGQASTIRLEELVNDGKIIVFDLGAWGNFTAAGAFGRMVIAQLAAIGMRRATRPGENHIPVHIYVDEADLFVGPAVLNILSKLRQQGVHLTLAQQTVGKNLEGDEKRQLLDNTAIKFTSGEGQREMLTAMHAPADATRGLADGQFIGRWGRKGEAFRIQVRSDLADDNHAMSRFKWQDVVARQLARYYTDDSENDGNASDHDEAPRPEENDGDTWAYE